MDASDVIRRAQQRAVAERKVQQFYATWTSESRTITFAGGKMPAVGDFVNGTGIPVNYTVSGIPVTGTYIVDISGTSITLSAPTTNTNTAGAMGYPIVITPRKNNTTFGPFAGFNEKYDFQAGISYLSFPNGVPSLPSTIGFFGNQGDLNQ